MMIRLGLLFSLLFLCLIKPLSVYAQQDSSTLEGYVPPPMFGTQRPLPPKKARTQTPKMPAISQPAPPESIVSEPVKETPKTVKSKSAPAPISAKPKKKPPVKPVSPTTQQVTKPKPKPVKLPPIVPLETISTPTNTPEPVVVPVENNKVKPQPEPIDLILQKEIQPPPKAVAKPKQSSGVVKGPKTMPAVKKKDVETEILFEPATKTLPTVNLLKKEKTQENIETIEVKETAPQGYIAPKFSILPDGSRKLNLIFSEMQAELNAEQKYSLNQLIAPLLQGNSKTRLRLEAYASPRDGSLSGDRRIALSRAMAIRKHIIGQNITANRLDVRSLGAQTDVVPMDRVEIFIVNP